MNANQKTIVEFCNKKAAIHCDFIRMLAGERYDKRRFEMLESYLVEVYLKGCEEFMRIGVRYYEHFARYYEFVKQFPFVGYEGVVENLCKYMKHYMFIHSCSIMNSTLGHNTLSKPILFHLAVEQSEDVDKFLSEREKLIEQYNNPENVAAIINKWQNLRL